MMLFPIIQQLHPILYPLGLWVPTHLLMSAREVESVQVGVECKVNVQVGSKAMCELPPTLAPIVPLTSQRVGYSSHSHPGAGNCGPAGAQSS